MNGDRTEPDAKALSTWSQRLFLTCETHQPPQNPSRQPNRRKSAYWRFGVNFDMRKSMSSPTP